MKHRRLSLRNRISVFFSITFLSVLLLQMSALYAAQNHYLDSLADDVLMYRSKLLTHIWIEERDKGPERLKARMDHSVKSSLLHIAVFTLNGKRVYSRNVPHAPALLSRADCAALERAPLFRTVSQNGRPYRVLLTAMTHNGRRAGYLMLEYSLSLMARMDQLILWSAPITILFMLFPVFLLGRLLVRQILRSIETVTHAANRIREGDLDASIDTAALEPELRPLATDFNTMRERLRETFDMLRRFTSDASHELRTPLTVMKTNIEVVLQRERPTDEYVETLSATLDEINRLSRIVNALLTLTSADAARDGFRKDPVDLDAVVQNVADFLAPMADDKGIRLALALDSARVLGEEEWLRRVIFNLLDNSLKFCRPDDTINIRLARRNGNVHLEVSDTGPGITPEHLPHVFDRFYRAPGDPDRSGAGIGLALCRWIVQGHDGDILASSPPGQGASFTVTLPAKD